MKAEKKKFDLGPADSKQRRKTKNQRPKSVPAETRLPAETGWNGPKWTERAGTGRNGPRFWPRWNVGVPRTG